MYPREFCKLFPERNSLPLPVDCFLKSILVKVLGGFGQSKDKISARVKARPFRAGPLQIPCGAGIEPESCPIGSGWDVCRVDILVGLRAYPNNRLYCGRLQSPMPALSAKNVLNVEKTTSGEHFWPAALAS
jgi:hypothetical protein